ncbi:meckelin-like [Clupea harengus]|uniref:Meckelin-like n=1 Tax=Clupea harengus TaxID=7950 RepID=A0A8M1KH25_CLUHA|nr:meckelin-like [Clupea harengus]
MAQVKPIALMLAIFTGCVSQGPDMSIPLHLPSQCNKEQFFNSASLICEACGENQHRTPSGLACTCDDGFTMIDLGNPVVQCSPCNGTVSNDKRRCLRCAEGDCQCGAGQTRVESLTTLTASCFTCSPDTLGIPASPICGLCQESFYTVTGSCHCPDAQLTGEVCFTSTAAASVSGSLPQDSVWFKTYLDSSLLGCMNYNNLTACQLLANMVTLDARRADSKAVNLYQLAASLQPPLPFLPGLYQRTETPTFPRGLTFSSNEKLPLMLASYNASGGFLGWEDVTGGILQLCPDTQPRLNAVYLFGATYQHSCSISVQELLTKYPKPVFHQLFLRHHDNDGTVMVWPIPIQSQISESRTSVHSVQRFFLVDGLTGRADSLMSPPRSVHYLSSLMFSVHIPTSSPGAKPPLQVSLQYRTARVADEARVQVSFAVTYSMDEVSMHLATTISVAVLSVVALLVTLVETSSWSRRSGQQTLNFTTLMKFLAFLSGNLANTFFLVTFGTGVFWLVAYKAQRSIVTTTLPSPGGNIETYFKSYVSLAFILKALQLLHLLVVQLSIDIFLIDWERPQNKPRGLGPSPSGPVASAAPSAWRRLLVANEWNELQAMRRISPVFQLLAALLLLQVVGLVNLATSDLQLNLQLGGDGHSSPSSLILRHGIITSVWLGLGLLQVLMYHLFYERCVEDKVRQFVDLCSISNVSVLVLMHRCYGYYIHGRSVHGYADVSIETLRNNLRNEEEDRCARRGLEPHSDTQVFEVALTERFRQLLDTVSLPLAELNQRRRHGEGAERQTQTATVTHNLNTLLSLFLQHSLKDMDYIVKDKLSLERIMKYEFQPPAERSVFYRDPDGVVFGEVLYYGKELLLLIFDTLLFSVIDLACQDLVLAAVLTYTVQQGLDIMRFHVSRRNLSSKTLVDQCFLI